MKVVFFLVFICLGTVFAKSTVVEPLESSILPTEVVTKKEVPAAEWKFKSCEPAFEAVRNCKMSCGEEWFAIGNEQQNVEYCENQIYLPKACFCLKK